MQTIASVEDLLSAVDLVIKAVTPVNTAVSEHSFTQFTLTAAWAATLAAGGLVYQQQLPHALHALQSL